MSLLSEIGYEHRPANSYQRLMQRLVSSKAGSAMSSKTMRHLDDMIFRLSGGKSTAVSLTGGISTFTLTTTGAKSGQPRTSHLIGFPHHVDIAIIGSNWGGASTPSWAYNLEANPKATLTYMGNSVPVRASHANEEEIDEIFEKAGAIYPGYPLYRERASHRTIKIFVLALDVTEGSS